MTCSISSPLLLLLLLSSSLERIQVAKRSLISTFPCALFMPPSVKTCLAVFSTCKTTDGQALASATRERLNAMAQEWADFLVDEICLSNSGFTVDGVRLGENITSRWSNGELEESGVNTDTVYCILTITANDVVANWYQEASRFKYGREPVSIQGIANVYVELPVHCLPKVVPTPPPTPQRRGRITTTVTFISITTMCHRISMRRQPIISHTTHQQEIAFHRLGISRLIKQSFGELKKTAHVTERDPLVAAHLKLVCSEAPAFLPKETDFSSFLDGSLSPTTVNDWADVAKSVPRLMTTER
ncbi:unnamed protein product [Hydatigera taeniaeformis]|uniref:SCP domain-containing protein n=1 Tax=Hydatigena taeniaeformis TaxID=6205 RepID=A0A0R3X5Z9_HYDTA|nr:unnamed protein product [Hydatigera taeniaeformis]